MSRTIAALYDTRSEAELARAWLISEFKPRTLRILGKDTAAAIDGLKIAPPDAKAYREGLRRGGHLLVAEVPSGAPADRIIDLLRQSIGATTDDRSEQQWGDAEQGVRVELSDRPAQEQAQQAAASSVHTEVEQQAEPEVDQTAQPQSRAPEPVTAPRTEQVADAAQEELRIGEPQTIAGGARVRAFTRESPAEEQVLLREDVIDVDGRPCGRRLTDNEIDAGGLFKERTLEVAAMREEPVVTKTAVVREEVIVTKRVKVSSETIRDTVRRTEIELEGLP